MHVRPMEINYDHVLREIDWISESANSEVQGNITLKVYFKESFYSRDMSGVQQLNNAKMKAAELVAHFNACSSSNSNRAIAAAVLYYQGGSNGGVSVSRVGVVKTHQLGINARTFDIPGKTYPYLGLRNRIKELEFGTAVDVEYDGAHWTAAPALPPGFLPLVSREHFHQWRRMRSEEEFRAYVQRHYYPTLGGIYRRLHGPPHIATPGEWEEFLYRQSRCLNAYMQALEQWEQSTRAYWVYAPLSPEQLECLARLHGRVLDPGEAPCSTHNLLYSPPATAALGCRDAAVHTELVAVLVPSQLLLESERRVLSLDRFAYTPPASLVPAPPIQFPPGSLLGWVGEAHPTRPGTTLITFPYREESHRQSLRAAAEALLQPGRQKQ